MYAVRPSLISPMLAYAMVNNGGFHRGYRARLSICMHAGDGVRERIHPWSLLKTSGIQCKRRASSRQSTQNDASMLLLMRQLSTLRLYQPITATRQAKPSARRSEVRERTNRIISLPLLPEPDLHLLAHPALHSRAAHSKGDIDVARFDGVSLLPAKDVRISPRSAPGELCVLHGIFLWDGTFNLEIGISVLRLEVERAGSRQ